MVRRAGWRVWLLGILAIAWVPVPALAQEWRVAKLGEDGEPVQALRLHWSADGTQPFQPRDMRVNDKLAEGAVLQAGSGIEIDLVSPKGVRVSKASAIRGTVKLDSSAQRGEGIEVQRGTWSVVTGKVASAVDAKLNPFNVKAGGAQALTRGTAFTVAVEDDGCQVRFRVTEGAILVSLPFQAEVAGLKGSVGGTQRRLLRAGDPELRLPIAPGGMARRFDDLGLALAAFEGAAREAQERVDPEARVDALVALGDLYLLAGRATDARTHFDLALPLVALPDERYWKGVVEDRRRMAEQGRQAQDRGLPGGPKALAAGSDPGGPGYAALEARIQALRDGRRPEQAYHLAKAQCWLDASRHELLRNDRSAFARGSVGETEKLVSTLEAGRLPDSSTPAIGQGRPLRGDLWNRIAAVKAHPGAACAAAQLACAEVGLVHAAHEFAQQQWRHAQPYVQRTEELVADAEALANGCPPPAPAQAASPPVPAAAARPTSAPEPILSPPAPPVLRKLSYAADAFFDVGQAQLKAEGRARLQDLAEKTRGFDLETVIVVGHTDALGSETANQRLSLRRAAAVKDFLVAQGMPAGRFFIEGKGGRSPVADNRTAAGRAANRRVEVEVIGSQRAP